MNCIEFDTPLGAMLAADRGDGLAGCWFIGQRHFPAEAGQWHRSQTPTLAAVREQLDAYFASRLTDFDLPLAALGSAFQQSVWQQLRSIPYGQRSSYGQIASALGKPAASRAVGTAVGRNPWSIIVPCHRVLGSCGQLTGYAGGLARKRGLLALEADPHSQ
ncbi:MAG: methylated-DNA--[protein]-cysteine S-methyltransferase [Wenzhouxiangella sp.]|nr:methylated-DNA--[protein]-cysteine S-methyltransferase [Wenzhouxiangella sp.]TVR93306.1 MAG: methylated-DNA--[protein]-cysteine S-methyltransferase [Wenzhouxiangellaceae bacterium]